MRRGLPGGLDCVTVCAAGSRTGAVRCGAVRAVRVFGRCLHSGVDDGSGRKRTRVSEHEFGQFVEVGVLESYLRTNKRHGRTGRWRLGVVAVPEYARTREGRNAAETQQRRGDVVGDGEVDVDVEVVVGEALAAKLVDYPGTLPTCLGTTYCRCCR